jgi:lysophospholipase L1-like esterase
MVNAEPDIVIVMLGTNDTNANNSDEVRAMYENDYRDMIDLLQGFSSDPRVVLCYPPPIHALDPIADSLIRNEIIPIIDRLGEDYQLEIADTYYKIDDYPENYPDDLHPNKGGVITLAEIIAERMGF